MAASTSFVSAESICLDRRILLVRELKISTLTEKVESIIREFQTNTDPLSKKIFEWIDHTIEIISKSEDSEESTLMEKVSDSTRILLQTILINPIDKSPLEQPMIVENSARTVCEIWEKWMLDESIKLFGNESQIHPEISLTTARPHRLAEETLKIAKELVDDVPPLPAIIRIDRKSFEKASESAKRSILSFFMSPLRQFALCVASAERKDALVRLEMGKRAEEGIIAATDACSKLEETVSSQCARSLQAIEEMRRQNSHYEETLASMQTELERFETDLRTIEAREKELSKDIDALKEVANDLRERINETNRRISKHRKKTIYKFWC
jgi:hypothetical protein